MSRPSVVFEAVPPVSPDVLPRMDVAAFVGFADAGPVDVPVPIEDMARFRDIFGADPALAFDTQRSGMHRGYLGATVESFLGSGGRRCWVVRVADDPELGCFDIPGLVRLQEDASAFDAQATFGYARSPGVWAAGLRPHTTFREEPLLAVPPARGGGPLLRRTTAQGVPQLSLLVAQPPGAITAGDTLRITTRESSLELLLVVGAVEPVDRALRVTSVEWVLAHRIADSTPDDPELRSSVIEVVDPDLFDDGPSSPWSSVQLLVDRLTFDLSVWRGDQVVGRIGRLAFSRRHPRFWGNLPTDVDLYWREPARRVDRRDQELEDLWAEAAGSRGAAGGSSGSRFPIAGPEPADVPVRGWPLYLPSAMPRTAAPSPTILSQPPPKPPSRSGLETPRPEMFVDDRLRNDGGESLRRAAEQVHGEVRDRDRRAAPGCRLDRVPGDGRSRPCDEGKNPAQLPRLRGIHALLAVEEATLVCVPDVVHPGWSKLAPDDTSLHAPELTAARISDAGDELVVEWTRVAGATAYVLAISTRPDFETVETTYTLTGEASSPGQLLARLPSLDTCESRLYVRVHARRDGEPSPWSNTITVSPGPGAFIACASLAVEDALRLSIASATRTLQWGSDDQVFMPDARFQIQSARDPLFETSVISERTAARERGLPEAADAPIYWRVRLEAAGGGASGTWSNTAVYRAPSLTLPLLDTVRVAAGRARFDTTLLLAVHRALLRFCHARGDLLALLSLPHSFGQLDARDYLAALTPDDSAILRNPSGAVASGAVPSERPFTLAESVVLSHAALFFPWLAHSAGASGGVERPRFIPCDGVAAGQLARTALERGAWIAAANRVVPAVLAVDPRLQATDVDQLLDLQVNVLARSAPGFVVLDEQTLSRDRDTRPISVRRLLILVKRLALREGAALVFEPHDADLHERVLTDFERMLSSLHQRGAFRGTTPEEAFRVVADDTVNPSQAIDAGLLVVELRVAPSEPLKFLRVRLVQSGPQQIAVGES